MRLIRVCIVGLVFVMGVALVSHAEVPTEMNVQGRFTDSSGAPIADTTLDVRFAVYDQQFSGSQLWPSVGTLETHSIQTNAQGLWNARIGSIIPLTKAAFTDTSRWLQVVVNTDAGLIDLPRVILNTSPFAFNAVMSQHADTADVVLGGSPGPYLPLAGGIMSGPITSTGDPDITMGRGNFGTANTLTGNWGFVAGSNNTVTGQFATNSGGTNNHADFTASTVGGGASNSAHGDFSTISGGGSNATLPTYSTIGGGSNNAVNGSYGTVGGGEANQANGQHSFVAGGLFNRATAFFSSIGGGDSNIVEFDHGTIAGGHRNSVQNGAWGTVGGGLTNAASGEASTIAGGQNNVATSFWSYVGGGYVNFAEDTGSAISGGYANVALGAFGAVGGGRYNRATGRFATIGGGGGMNPADSNSASGDWSTVGGGTYNHAMDIYTTISGGQYNTATNWNATVGGGYFNVANGLMATVGGGSSNSAVGDYASVAGGVANDARTFATTVAGGNDNDATASAATVGGGQYNKAKSFYATIAGGASNEADSIYSVIGGGNENIAAGGYATVAGGDHNHVYSLHSTIGGGSSNLITNGEGVVIAGGALNSAYTDGATIGGGVNGASIGHYSTLGGGYNNISSGISATVPGGEENEAAGDNSFAAGFRAKATHAGSFVWSDHTLANFNSLYDDEFAIRATNGIRSQASFTAYGCYFNNAGNGDGVRTYGNTSQGNNWAALYAYNTGTSPAVYGYSSGGPAAYFAGNVTVTGTLTKGGGAFKIDHPLDPANKYLLHSFVESPDMKDVYDGVVTLDANGEAWVDLPNWFGALNRDFRYQLTCVGGYAPVYIADEITGNRFRIAGGKAGLKVSWQVTGIRQDAYANAHRIPVEEDKSLDERGKYLHPEAFGFSKDAGITSVADKR